MPASTSTEKESLVSKSAHRWMLVALLFLPSVAAAQERGDVGVFMGYPNLGFVWQVSDKVAIRPEISFSSTSTEIESNFGGSGTSHIWSVGFGASALLYLNDADRLRTYLAPQFTYNRADVETDDSINGTDSDSYGFAGLFGAQYSLNDRFSIFGELGLGYSHSSTESPLSSTTSKSDRWSTRTGVGVILFF